MSIHDGTSPDESLPDTPAASAPTDAEKCQSVIDDAVSGNSSIEVRCIAAMLGSLMLRYGAQFTIDGAVQALDDIVKYAEIFKQELNK